MTKPYSGERCTNSSGRTKVKEVELVGNTALPKVGTTIAHPNLKGTKKSRLGFVV